MIYLLKNQGFFLFQSIDNSFILSFTHRFLDFKGATTYFAFCYPWSYTESQERLAFLDEKFAHCSKFTSKRYEIILYHIIRCKVIKNY